MSPLAGRRILVTRAAEEPPVLDELLRNIFAQPVRLPCIAYAPPRDRTMLDAALVRLRQGKRPDFIAIASGHAADRLVAELQAAGIDVPSALSEVAILAAGAATARHLEALGIPARAPARGTGADAMLAAFSSEVGEREILVPRAEEGNPALVEGFRKAGARVVAVPLYRTVPAASADTRAEALLLEGKIDAIAFASGSAARGFASLFGSRAPALARGARVACMGETCAEAARAAGLAVDAVAAGGFADLVRILEALFAPT
jgi:uroporphyrinogen-III synthase